MGCTQRTKNSNASVASTILRTGVQRRSSYIGLRLTGLSNFRTHKLLDALKENGLKGEPVDFVWVEFTFHLLCGTGDKLNATSYVDEVQDMLLIDTKRTFHDRSSFDGVLMQVAVIISLCRNPDGFLWAGDTAQTISIGSTFTFKQLGASVYRYQVCNHTEPLNSPGKPSSRGRYKHCAEPPVNLRDFNC